MKKNRDYWIAGANNTIYKPGQRTGLKVKQVLDALIEVWSHLGSIMRNEESPRGKPQ